MSTNSGLNPIPAIRSLPIRIEDTTAPGLLPPAQQIREIPSAEIVPSWSRNMAHQEIWRINANPRRAAILIQGESAASVLLIGGTGAYEAKRNGTELYGLWLKGEATLTLSTTGGVSISNQTGVNARVLVTEIMFADVAQKS